MNQKQRDYLIKRLEVIKNEKIASFKVEDPNLEPFIRKLKIERVGVLMNKINKVFKNPENKTKGSYYDYTQKGRPWTISSKVTGFSTGGYAKIEDSDYFTNLDEIQEKYREHCEKHYQVVTDRHKLIETKYVEMCDQIIFAEDYEQAAKLIKEFLKF